MLFYACEGLLYLSLLLISIYMNYIFGLKIENYNSNPIKKKRVLIISIVCNVILLGIFKYSNFIVDNINIQYHLSHGILVH